MTASAGLHTGRPDCPAAWPKASERATLKLDQKSDCGAYIDPTLPHYLRCDVNDHR